MKSMKRVIIMLGVMLMGTLSANAQFDLGSIFNKAKDVVKEVAGDAVDEYVPEELQELLGIAIPELEIPGTWSYIDVAVEFESADALTSAGGKVAAQTVEEKVKPYLEKVGIKPGAFNFTFLEDGTATTTLGKKTVKGTWSYNKEEEKVTLGIGGKEFSVRMTENGEHINILFPADKLLELVKTVSTKSSNTTIVAIGAIVKAYDGMNVGFECEKVK